MKKEIVSALSTLLRENQEEQIRALLPTYRVADIERALRNIRSIAADVLILPSFAQLSGILLPELARAPDPDAALNNFERFTKAVYDPLHLYSVLTHYHPILKLLIRLFGTSQFLSDVLIRNPEYFDWLIQAETLHKDKTEAHYLSELRQSIALFKSSEARHRAVCRYRRRELLRIGARDILRLSALTQIVAELSDLASAITKVALSVCWEEMEKMHGTPQLGHLGDVESSSGLVALATEARPCQFCIIGMGKLGGSELNFSSDVDLIFVYEEEGKTSGREESGGELGRRGDRVGITSNHEFFSRLCELLINFLSEKTAEGHLYRVDSRLRPEGAASPLARSLESYENYFFSQGRYWEKFAYLKACCVAGDAALFERFDKLVHEFIFADLEPQILFREVAKLKQRIDAEVLTVETQQREVKRGYGGIREIEFLVHCLQMMYHQKSPALQTRSTLDALDALEQLNILPKRDARHLRDAYVFLRTLEHRLQMNYELQTHVLPDRQEELHRLARKMNYRGSSQHPAEEVFAAEYRRHTARVHRLFERQFGEAATAAPTETVTMLALLDEDAAPQTVLALLRPYRLRDPATLQSIRSLARGSREVYITSGGQRAFESILPRVLELCRRVPFPDSALHNLDRFLRAAKGISAFYSLVIENPHVLELLMRILGSSDYLSRILISHPEYFDVIVDPESLRTDIPSDDDAHALFDSIRAAAEPASAFALLRRWKQLQLLRIGMCDLLELCAAHATAQNLTRLAELCIAASLELARNDLTKHHGEPQRLADGSLPQFCIVALGGFGGGETSYFSDLDLLFVYRGDGEMAQPPHISHRQFFTLVGEEIIQRMTEVTPEGTLFKVDARLRPEGAGAPLVYPLESYTAYYERDAQLWELQSFLKARTIAGDEALGRQLINDVSEIIARRASEFDLATEIAVMRRKLEESARVPSTALADFKRGAGGLVDIEFLVQYLQLKALQSHPPVILSEAKNLAFPQQFGSSPHTLAALSALARHALLPHDDADFLQEAYALLRNIESKIRLLFETSRDLFPGSPEKLEPLAIALGYTAEQTESLRQEFLRTTRLVRAVFHKLLNVS